MTNDEIMQQYANLIAERLRNGAYTWSHISDYPEFVPPQFAQINVDGCLTLNVNLDEE
jgi:hypothetical protein